MNSLFESIKQGLNEAIEYEKGNLTNVKTDKISVSPVTVYTGTKVKEIRTRHNLTQRVFAEALGVSVKTVEAWEANKNTPSGCASRMLELMERDNSLLEKYSIVARQ
jgi:putative transcriptional regulator